MPLGDVIVTQSSQDKDFEFRRLRIVGQGLLLLALSLGFSSAKGQPGPAVLSNISAERLNGTVRVELLIDREVQFKTVALRNPDRVYIDLEATLADQHLVNTTIDVADTPLRRIRTGQHQFSVARVVFDLAERADFRTYYLTDPFRIFIEFQTPSPSSIPRAEPSQATAPRSIQRSSTDEFLEGVRAQSDADQTSVELSFSGPVQFTTGKLASPARFYFDFSKTRIGKSLPTHQYPINDSRLQRIRIGQNRLDLTRVVFDLPFLVEPSIERMESGSRIRIVFRSSPASTIHLDTPETAPLPDPPPSPLARPPRVPSERALNVEPAPVDLTWGMGPLETLPLRFHSYTVFSAPRVSRAFRPATPPPTVVAPTHSVPVAPPDSTPGEPASLVLDELVVRVNGDYITLSEWTGELALLRAEIMEQYATDEEVEVEFNSRKRTAMREMVERRLLAERAQLEGLDQGIDEKVDSFIQKVCSQAGLPNESALDRILRSRGTSISKYRTLVKERLSAELLLQRVVETKGVVFDIEVLRYYQENSARFMQKGQVELAEVFLNGLGRTPQQLPELTSEIEASLAAGTPFEEVAARYSDGTTAAGGGRLGIFEEGSLDSQVEPIVAGLEVGEVSASIRKGTGTQFVKLLRRIPAAPRPYGEVSPIIRNELQEQKIQQVLADYVDKLWQDSFVVLMPAYEGQYQLPVR
ncbi:MAG: AMIN domain-containing protein [Acidobacteriota bacterium]|nr:MAG: AMIN domain-containing protein [Acidobacteriota bacterium]